MIIFINEDKPYLHWVTHHRRGFVLAGRRKPKLGHLVLHRATCPEVKTSATRRARFTTGDKLKACSFDSAELGKWAVENDSCEPTACPACSPLDMASAPSDETHLTRFGKEILDYVLEAAAIHFEDDSPPYRLSVDDIANCLGKSLGSTVPALRALLSQDMIDVRGKSAKRTTLLPRTMIFPTAKAIRTLDAFAGESDEAIAHELQKLTSGE